MGRRPDRQTGTFVTRCGATSYGRPATTPRTYEAANHFEQFSPIRRGTRRHGTQLIDRSSAVVAWPGRFVQTGRHSSISVPTQLSTHLHSLVSLWTANARRIIAVSYDCVPGLRRLVRYSPEAPSSCISRASRDYLST